MKLKKLIVLALGAVLLSSCGSYQRMAYLQDMQLESSYSVPDRPEARISKGDKLGIVVSCGSPALATPFNVVSGVYTVDPATGTQNVDIQRGEKPEYEVNEEGKIVFPVLGEISVAGMTLKQVKELIESMIISRRYIKDPVVSVEFTNFQITILGEVSHVGNFQIANGNIDIFEAIALAGDLTGDAMRDNIIVVRTSPGKRKAYNINIKSKDCYYSPVFYLQQNDMVYVPPKDTKKDTALDNISAWSSSILSAVSIAANILLWYAIYLK